MAKRKTSKKSIERSTATPSTAKPSAAKSSKPKASAPKPKAKPAPKPKRTPKAQPAPLFNFFLPAGTKVRTAIHAFEVTGLVKVNFHIARFDIPVWGITCDLFKVWSTPPFTATIVAIA